VAANDAPSPLLAGRRNMLAVVAVVAAVLKAAGVVQEFHEWSCEQEAYLGQVFENEGPRREGL